MRFLMILTLLVAGTAQAADKQAKKEKIAVLPFLSKAGNGELISQVLATMLLESKVYDVVDRAHLKRVFDEKQIVTMSASDEELLAGAAIAAADYLVVGEVGMLGSKNVLNVRMLKVADGSVAMAKMISWTDQDRMEGMMRSLVRKLTNSTDTAAVAFDPRFGSNIARKVARTICRPRAVLRGSVRSNMMGQLTIDLGSERGLIEGSTMKVLRGGQEIGELELTTVKHGKSEGMFAQTGMEVAQAGDTVLPDPMRIAVAEFAMEGGTYDTKALAKHLLSHFGAGTPGCTIGKRRPITKFDGMSRGRKKRLRKKVDAVVSGKVVTRGGRMVGEVQVIDPGTGSVLAEFAATKY